MDIYFIGYPWAPGHPAIPLLRHSDAPDGWYPVPLSPAQ